MILRRKNNMLRKGLVFALVILFIGVSVLPSISGNINSSRDVAIVKDGEQLSSSITVTFTRPKNGIYCFDKKILPFSVPLIFCGKITIEAEIESGSEVMIRIEFYINDVCQQTITGSGPQYDFTWVWGGPTFSKVNFKIVAYTMDAQASDEITIYRLFN